ncbi:MAG: M48 family metallopeptidase [Phascolarctobacterium sp.]|nr:M48 family metallopeptidase [Phascolarctobacterium sp.]MEE1230802.1 M48 family metallopeptidase [Phascolarctobacterium sp.]
MYKLYKLFLAFVVACCCFVGLQPAEAGMISLEDEIKMGRETAQQLEAKYGLSQDYYLNERVDRIGQRLAAVCGRNEITYSFKVLNCNEVNALACPGGFIYVFKGLMDYMPSDTELAGVLGHEVGHVAKKHTVHSIEKQLWTSLILLAATRGQGLGLVQAAQQALFAGYSRTDERGADKEGVNNTIKAGFNPYAMLITVQKLDDLSKQGGGANYGLFSSHPEPEERVKRVLKQLKEYNIHPDVTVVDDNHATVTEGNWRFDINQSIGNTKAKYRAYMLAGGLWNVRQRGKINPNYFVVYDNGSYAHIYYDDIQVLTLYTQDAGAWGSAGAYASACVDMLRDWAVIANENDAKAAAKAKKKK